MYKFRKKVLLIGPSWLGDMVMAQSVMKVLKDQGVNEIDLLAPKWCLEVAKCMPEINNLIESNLAHGELGLLKRYKLGKSLRFNSYDQAIVLPNSLKSAIIPWIANIPIRTGWKGELRYGLINDMRILNKSKLPLMLQRYAQLGLSKENNIIQSPPLPKLIPIKPEETIKKFLLETKEPFIICPGAAGGKAKRWPIEHYISVAKDLIEKGKTIWLMGSINDKEVTDKIANDLPNGHFANLAGQLSLVETVNIISYAKSLITNDSGLMHVASALNVPVIAIYGPTSPEHTPPLGEKSRVIQNKLPCSPCFKKECPLSHHRCMTDIKPSSIIQNLEATP